ncbi:potassium transporter KtrB [Lacrimispora sp. NSJ-141]|uniref:Potassium transporter KtrB n=1 Tax=Lientehia hominis TaxID=2897778 RepID=A0AAP2RIT2_9FIRM|nr:potassium transporter TrkG [Lientehia hominis]MCD2492199.1 potassium transporter KtrB [Lientehia hominis]
MVEQEIHPKEKRGLTTTRIIALGFAAAILVGAVLLMFPFASADGTWTNPIDALFTATTSICVTGLVTVVTASHWSILGQFIIMLLAQLGGLGVITVAMCVLVIIGKKITLKDRMLIQETYNMDTLSGLVKLIIRIAKGTFLLEGIGAVLYATVFIPEFGFFQGLWKSIFNAVSAFCNAGMDIVGDTSLRAYAGNPIINFTTMLLIIFGGLGFVVWWNVLKAWKERKEKKRGFAAGLSLHSKLVLLMTAILIFGGALFFFLFEYNNPDTIGNMNFGEKAMASLFQSVTTRTAGFETIPQAGLTEGSTLLTIILMIIGGSPAGTAGGIKTTTVGILILMVLSTIQGKKDTEFMDRRISADAGRTALTVTVLALTVVLGAAVLLFATDGLGFQDTLFEVASAMGTVGLTRGITSSLTGAGKLILVCVMYIGRIGPVTLALALALKRKGKQQNRMLPEERILIG